MGFYTSRQQSRAPCGKGDDNEKAQATKYAVQSDRLALLSQVDSLEGYGQR